MHTLKHILIAATTAVQCGCVQPPAPNPIELKIAVNDIYCMDTACACVHDIAARTYPQTLEELRTEHRIVLHLVYFPETYQLEDAIAAGEVDGALCKPWYALRHQKEAGANFRRIVDVLDPNDNRWLTGSVIVPVGAPIQTLEELTGKHVYLGQPDAYEKHQAALRLFRERGIKPAKIDTKASCGENIGVLLDEEADAAVISDYSLSADCASDFARPEDFRILEQTERIPLTSLILDMNKVTPAEADRLQKALLALSGKNASETLLGGGFVKPSPWSPPELEAP
ncbi:MAG: PhnD/SsuA/transferrin family substrate-binding protein [Verrucomicrobiota bacterium]|nr:PhnD/SsuA/transferrin family substrate-binding protein [Verrucomicrobiota bacterium]